MRVTTRVVCVGGASLDRAIRCPLTSRPVCAHYSERRPVRKHEPAPLNRQRVSVANGLPGFYPACRIGFFERRSQMKGRPRPWEPWPREDCDEMYFA